MVTTIDDVYRAAQQAGRRATKISTKQARTATKPPAGIHRREGQFVTRLRSADGRPLYQFRVSTSGKKADGYDIRPESWDLRRFLKNPTVLLNHDVRSLPIGVAERVWADADGLLADIWFDTDDPDAARVAGKIDRGVMRQTSVNFRITGQVDRSSGIVPPGCCELMEISVVSLGEDADALRLRSALRGKAAKGRKPQTDADKITDLVVTWSKAPEPAKTIMRGPVLNALANYLAKHPPRKKGR